MKKTALSLLLFSLFSCGDGINTKTSEVTNEIDADICNTKPGKGFQKTVDSRDKQEYSYHEFSTLSWMSDNARLEGEGAYIAGETAQGNNEMMYTKEAAEKACPQGWRLPTTKEWIEYLVCKGAKVEDINGETRLSSEYDIMVQFAQYGRGTLHLVADKDGFKLPSQMSQPKSTYRELKNYWTADLKNGQPVAINFFITKGDEEEEVAMAWVVPEEKTSNIPVKYCRCVQ